jgi:hypothetical protein
VPCQGYWQLSTGELDGLAAKLSPEPASARSDGMSSGRSAARDVWDELRDKGLFLLIAFLGGAALVWAAQALS